MRALVTGSAGFIGYHLCRRLLHDGHTVVGFDGLTPYYDTALKKRRHALLESSPAFTPVIGRLEDRAALAGAVETARPDVIAHLAAQAGVRYSAEDPQAYVDANLTGSFNLLEVSKAAQPNHLLLASTSSIYGAATTFPLVEASPTDRPVSLYAATKASMEAMAHASAHLNDIPTTALRFFTVYGPWGRPDMALFKFVDAILNDRPIEVYGHGRMKRDLTFVDDVIEAVVRLIPLAPAEENRLKAGDVADSLSPNAPYRAVNIGGGYPVGLLEIIEETERILGKPAKKVELPMQPGDVRETHASPALLEALTGYRPSTKFVDGARAFIDWYRGEWKPSGE